MSDPQYVGIDLSLTSTGLAFVEGPLGWTGRVTSKPVKATDDVYLGKLGRFHGIASTIWGQVHPGAHVFLEGPSYGSAGQATHDIAGNWWNVYRTLHTEGRTVTVIPPATVKQYATGKGNAPKDQVMAAAIKRYPAFDIGGNDEADAVVLVAIGLRLHGIPLEDDMPATHLKALAKLVAVPVP